MKVTIITPCYNSSSTIADTLRSVSQQTYPFIEHIIIDGASTDNTLEIVKQFQHVAAIVSEKDKGIYDAMNKGIEKSTGDLIGILNSDDFYQDEKVIEDVVALFASSRSDTVYGDLLYVNPDNTHKVERNWKAGKYRASSFLWGWMPPHPTFFVRRELYAKFGKFDLALRSAADYELMLRLLYKHQVSTSYLPRVLVRMRSGGNSNASLRNRWKANQEDRKAWAMNNLTPNFLTLILKPIRKIFQYL